VRLIDTDGEQLGIFSTQDALKKAYEKDLDLVEVAPQAKPPVCRIMDYGKFKYEQAKKDREARKNQRTINIKELKMRVNIDEHDFQVKVKSAKKFLKEGDKIKVTIMFRGREIVHSELGKRLLDRLAEEVNEEGLVERKPNVEGKNMIMILAPKDEKAKIE